MDEFESALDTEDIKKAEEVGQRLHDAILEKTGNSRISQHIAILASQIERMNSFARHLPGREKEAMQEHRNIVQVLRSDD